MSNLPKKNSSEMVNQDQFSQDMASKKTDAQVLLAKKRNLLSRILPSVEDKVAKQHSKAILEQESSADLEVRRMSNKFFNDALKATFDEILTKGLEQIKERKADDFSQRKADLNVKITRRTKDFFSQMEKIEGEVLEVKNERSRKRQLKMIDQRYDEYETTVNSLMQEYDDSHNKSVGDKD